MGFGHGKIYSLLPNFGHSCLSLGVLAICGLQDHCLQLASQGAFEVKTVVKLKA